MSDDKWVEVGRWVFTIMAIFLAGLFMFNLGLETIEHYREVFK